MAVEKLGGSTLGGAAAGAQVGSLFGPAGTAIGGVIGGIGGLAYGAAQPGDPVLKLQRKQRRLDKIRGKRKDLREKGKEGSKRMDRLTDRAEDVRDDMSTLRESGDPGMQQYRQMEELANQKVVGVNRAEEVQKLRGTLSGGPGAGQRRLAGTADEMVTPDEAATTAQLYGAVSQADQMAAAEQEGQRAAATAGLVGLEGQAEAQAAAENQQFMQTATAMGGLAKDAIGTSMFMDASKPISGDAVTTDPNETGYATTKKGLPVMPSALTPKQQAQPGAVESYEQAKDAYEAYATAQQLKAQNLGYMMGFYRKPTSGGN